MSVKKNGKNSSQNKSKPEILNISPYGMWVLMNQKEYYIDYTSYPWFKEANVREIANVKTIGFNSGLHRPDLDIDVAIEALEHPERFPLIANMPIKKKKKVIPVQLLPKKSKKQRQAA